MVSQEEAYNSLLQKFTENEENSSNLTLQNQKLLSDIDVYKSQLKKLHATNDSYNKNKGDFQATIDIKDKLIGELNAQLQSHINEKKETSNILKSHEELIKAVYISLE